MRQLGFTLALSLCLTACQKDLEFLTTFKESATYRCQLVASTNSILQGQSVDISVRASFPVSSATVQGRTFSGSSGDFLSFIPNETTRFTGTATDKNTSEQVACAPVTVTVVTIPTDQSAQKVFACFSY